jgi:predicted MPP superfamily phosphohydrolase
MSIKIILFAALFMLIYFLLCFYIGYNGWVWLQSSRLNGKWKNTYIIIMVFLSLSLFLGQGVPFPLFKWISGFWMAILGYSLILLPIANIVLYLFKKRGIFWIGTGVFSIFTLILIIGSFNAWNPVVRQYDITLSQATEQPNLKILMASDLHLGLIVGESHLQKLVNIAEEVKPDIILLAGDIIDDHIEPFQEDNMGEMISHLQAPLGVYAISGNHDVYGDDLPILVQEISQAGIQFLRDEAVLVSDQFYLVGRKDIAEGARKTTASLLTDLDKTKPIIMLDHQPRELKEAEKAGVDILLSGHTHKGQLAPANLVTGMLFENDGGYLKKENLHSFVSSGFGTWGPPLRIGSRSEVMVIKIY